MIAFRTRFVYDSTPEWTRLYPFECPLGTCWGRVFVQTNRVFHREVEVREQFRPLGRGTSRRIRTPGATCSYCETIQYTIPYTVRWQQRKSPVGHSRDKSMNSFAVRGANEFISLRAFGRAICKYTTRSTETSTASRCACYASAANASVLARYKAISIC